MNKTEFLKVVTKLPGLTEQGFMSTFHRDYGKLRDEFMERAVFLQQAIDASLYLRQLGKSKLMTKWQETNCTPQRLIGLVEWNAGRNVSQGAIIVGAIHEGFVMHHNGLGEPCFNIFARQLEGELRDFRVRELIKQAVG